jgi:thiol-disulfide isomerase/thioredoxin
MLRLASRRDFLKGVGAGVLITILALAGLVTLWLLRARQIVISRMEQREAAEVPGTPVLLYPPEINDSKVLGRAEYVWSIETLDGKTESFTQFRGKVLFLSFWATWCQPCIAEMPAIEALAKRFAGDPRLAFALMTDEEADTVRQFVRRKRLRLPVYLVRHGVPGSLWAQSRPVTQIIGCDGAILVKHFGAADWNSEPAVSLLNRSLAACDEKAALKRRS